jgi:hypothetical protein
LPARLSGSLATAQQSEAITRPAWARNESNAGMLRVKAHGQRDLITCDASGMDSLSQRDREFESASLQR